MFVSKEKVTCLLLDKRKHEQERLQCQFKDIGVDLEFFLVGDGTLFPANDYSHIDIVPPSGRVGYPAWVNRPNSYNAFLSYKKILQKALDSDTEIQWLCEDDVSIQSNFKEILKQAEIELAQLPEWDMLYLCANHTWAGTTQLSEHVLKLQGSGGFQFVGIKRRMFTEFINAGMNAPIDEIAGRLHKTKKCYSVWPNIAIPVGGYSHCEGYVYDNAELYKNKGC